VWLGCSVRRRRRMDGLRFKVSLSRLERPDHSKSCGQRRYPGGLKSLRENQVVREEVERNRSSPDRGGRELRSTRIVPMPQSQEQKRISYGSWGGALAIGNITSCRSVLSPFFCAVVRGFSLCSFSASYAGFRTHEQHGRGSGRRVQIMGRYKSDQIPRAAAPLANGWWPRCRY